MVVKDIGEAIPREARIRGYRGDALLSDVGNRIGGVEFHWAGYLAALRRGDATLAEGHLRMSVAKAVGLAARPTRTREDAARKAAFLTLAGARLDGHVAGESHGDHRGAIPMLAAAVDAEVRLWKLPRPKPGGGDPRMSPLSGEPSPALRLSLEFNAAPRTLAEAVADAEVRHSDEQVLAAEEDWGGVRGIFCSIRASLLHSLAIPATSAVALELKLSVIADWSAYLQPADLTRPMLEAVVPADGERFGLSVDLAAILASPSSDAGG